MSTLRVAVRCRPFSSKEKKAKQACIVTMLGDKTVLTNPKEDDDLPPRQFSFEYSFWSHRKKDLNFVTQEQVYTPVGESVLADAFAGYHACVFAYGQTGSGKSYTMMGTPSDPLEQGITPRLCQDLFGRIESMVASNPKWYGKVEVSYMEIYLEQVRDLLNPSSTKKLKVREHSLTGPYVESLSTHAVSDFAMVKKLMDEGDKLRTVRATKMNDVSSRSHAIFQIIFTQGTKSTSGKGKGTVSKKSKISLVDLAGSERSGQINVRDGDRMVEGNQINKSLSCLGKVMTALAERQPGKKMASFVPYRESVLTWLLRESLGGNSKTFMLAAISPSADNFDETLSTLRYANAAKKIVNAAVVNEDPTVRLVRMLEEEIASLKAQLALATITEAAAGLDSENGGVQGCTVSHSEASQKLSQLTMLMESLQTPWEEKVNNTASMQRNRLLVLQRYGVVADQSEAASRPVGVMAPEATPYLINLTHDPFSRHCLVYYLHDGKTAVTAFSRETSSADVSAISDSPSIMLQDKSIRENHCKFVTDFDGPAAATVRLVSSTDPVARAKVNGVLVDTEAVLHPGDTIELGALAFIFQNPSDPTNSESSTPGNSTPTTPMFGFRRSGVFDYSIATAIEEESGLTESSPTILSGDSAMHRPEFSPLRPRKNKTGVPTAQRPDSGGQNALERAMVGAANLVPETISATASSRRLSATSTVSFEWSKENESSYLVHLVVNMASSQCVSSHSPTFAFRLQVAHMHPSIVAITLIIILVLLVPNFPPWQLRFSFKLMPAYGLYMMFHGQRVRDEDASLEELQSRVARLVRLTVKSSRREENVCKLALLLANASELFHAMRTDEHLVTTSGSAQVMVLGSVEDAFQGVISAGRLRVRLCLGAVLREDAMVNGHDDETGMEDGERMVDLLESLSALHDLLKSTLMADSLVASVFGQLFFFMGAAVWNDFILSKEKEFYRWDRGLLIRFNLTQLADWAEMRGLTVRNCFQHITEACLLLQANKSSLAFLDSVCDACPSLNSLQVAKILKNYSPAEGDNQVPAPVMDCIVGRAMTVADVVDLQDEVAGCSVQLDRNEDFELPFRLVGPFHVDDGIYNRMLLEDAKAYLRVIDIANQSAAIRTVTTLERAGSAGLAFTTHISPQRAKTTQSCRQNSGFFGRWLTTTEEKKSPRKSGKRPLKIPLRAPHVSAREWIGIPS